jgi:hypothetical protein
MLTDTSRWSHARGNEVVPSRWQATRTLKETPLAFTAGSHTRVRNVLREIGVPVVVVNSRPSRPMLWILMCSATASSHAWRTAKVLGSLSLGYALGTNRSPVGECLLDTSMMVSSTTMVRRRVGGQDLGEAGEHEWLVVGNQHLGRHVGRTPHTRQPRPVGIGPTSSCPPYDATRSRIPVRP